MSQLHSFLSEGREKSGAIENMSFLLMVIHIDVRTILFHIHCKSLMKKFLSLILGLFISSFAIKEVRHALLCILLERNLIYSSYRYFFKGN